MALALYRKYRPRTFAEVIGQEHVTEPLSQALRSGRLHHAYLFSGPRGCGKTSSARILARSLNCEQGPTPEPCGRCESCRSLATDGGSIDVLEIDAASHGGVDDARELRERAVFAPATSRFKIYVIDEAHMVSSAGFNALLKLVEEPPEYVKFIFATTEPEKVLGTIKSRTHHYPFRLIPPGVLRPYLEQLTAAEGVKVEPAVFPLVVRAGGGSARDSLSVLDQLIAGAGPEGVSYARAVALLGVTDSALIDEMCDALAAGDGAAAYATVDRVAEAGHDPRRFAADLLERLRDLIVLQQVPDAATKGLIDAPSDQLERMTAQAERLGPATLSRCADIVHDGLVEMRGTTAPRLLLELICARMLLPGAEDSTRGLLQRLERMERRLTLTGDTPPPPAASTPPQDPHPVRTPAPTPAAEVPEPPAPQVGSPPPNAPASPAPPVSRPPSAAPASAPAAQPVAARPVPPEAVMPDPGTPDPEVPGSAAPGELDAAAVRRVWGDIVAMINRTNKRLAALVRDAVVRDLDGETLVLTMKSSVLANMVTANAEVLTNALYEELGGRWQIRCEVAGDQRAAGPSRSAPAAAPRNAPPASTPPAGRTAVPNGATAPATDRAPRTRPTAQEPSGGGDDDWPEPVPPGGLGNPASSGSTPPDGPAGSGPTSGGPVPGGANLGGDGTQADSSAGGGEEEWPEPVRLGGPNSTPDAGAAPGGRGGARPSDDSGANSTGSAGSPAPATRAGTGRVGAGLAAARAAAAGRGGPKSSAAPKTADQDWAGEPPYDPDYDGPPGSAAPVASAATAQSSYEGFDPGDEPLDEVVDEKTARQTSEQQAVQLFEQAFRAERIGEIEVGRS
ncbi:DNA polymerase III subunit gamma and tau [Solwaraspora sp. WMMD1047]|uniref:DNA polymerase III subunit gamma and tau n=1 Tax=Solwaraspora sp. WMMD1047 TaxID=3016102 RepID=UPI002417C1C2|nr:DNA polymerase III subunit gamma and tau [Solwaraspora sp. WMMD1047]MDG4834010.1 DNA polymerase III subunit gamma and tau [Solwaraspora sp. WMMD1047]